MQARKTGVRGFPVVDAVAALDRKRDFSPTMPQHASSDGEPKFLARNKIERQQISDVATSWALWQFGEDVA